jgi:hypothetical protein
LKTYYKVIIVKQCGAGINTDIQNSEIKYRAYSHYGHYEKSTKIILQGKDIFKNHVVLKKMDFQMQNNEVESLPYTTYKIELKDLNVRAKTKNFL